MASSTNTVKQVVNTITNNKHKQQAQGSSSKHKQEHSKSKSRITSSKHKHEQQAQQTTETRVTRSKQKHERQARSHHKRKYQAQSGVQPSNKDQTTNTNISSHAVQIIFSILLHLPESVHYCCSRTPAALSRPLNHCAIYFHRFSMTCIAKMAR